MNEMELLARMREEVPLSAVSQRAEDTFFAGLNDGPATGRPHRGAQVPPSGHPVQRARRLRPGRRAVIAGGLSLALAGGAVAAAVIPAGGTHPAPTAHVAVLAVTQRAAAAARAQPALAPGQWVYLKIMYSYPPPPTVGYLVNWETANGVWGVNEPHGKPFNFSAAVCQQDKRAGLTPACSITYQSLNSLPKAPAALLSYLENLYKSAPASARPAKAFGTINVLFNKFVMPPAILAEMYQALALIPGVTVAHNVIDLAGQRAVGLRYPGSVPLLGDNGEILLNPRTYLYVASQFSYPPSVPTYQNRHIGGTLYLRVVPVSGPGVQP